MATRGRPPNPANVHRRRVEAYQHVLKDLQQSIAEDERRLDTYRATVAYLKKMLVRLQDANIEDGP